MRFVIKSYMLHTLFWLKRESPVGNNQIHEFLRGNSFRPSIPWLHFQGQWILVSIIVSISTAPLETYRKQLRNGLAFLVVFVAIRCKHDQYMTLLITLQPTEQLRTRSHNRDVWNEMVLPNNRPPAGPFR